MLACLNSPNGASVGWHLVRYKIPVTHQFHVLDPNHLQTSRRSLLQLRGFVFLVLTTWVKRHNTTHSLGKIKKYDVHIHVYIITTCTLFHQTDYFHLPSYPTHLSTHKITYDKVFVYFLMSDLIASSFAGQYLIDNMSNKYSGTSLLRSPFRQVKWPEW